MEALSGITQFLQGGSGQGLLKLAELGMAGGGLIGNIANERARSGEISNLQKAEKTLNDPAALSAQVRAATQPLNQGLVQSTENVVSGDLASKGLAEAPGIQAATLAQALAPAEQQNQNTALQLVLTRLGLPLQYAQTILAGMPQNTNMAPLLALLQRNNNPAGGGSWGDLADPTLFKDIFGSIPGSTPTVPPSNTGDFNLPSDIWA